tara:strand:- start:445 stop:1284 length:840 start_codon:yes stop_codon:yes gene_type:complete
VTKVIYATGLSGFIGSHLLKLLQDNYSFVVNFRRNNQVEIYQDDPVPIEEKFSKDLMSNFRANTLFHLATNYDPNPKNIGDIEDLINSNFYFPANLIEKLEIDVSSFNLITTSSYMQLLKKDQQNIYSMSKDLFLTWYKKTSKNLTNIYLYDSFGSNDLRDKVVDVFIKKILQKEQLIIPENEIQINLTEVGDIVHTLINSISLERGEYQISSNKIFTLLELAEFLMEIIGHKVNIKRLGTGHNLISTIDNHPQDIYFPNVNSNLDDQLKKRVEELSSN